MQKNKRKEKSEDGKMRYRLAVFDLDGTILYTLEDLKISLNFALSANGLPERTLDETRRFVGNGIRKLIERAVPENSDPGLIDRVFDDFNLHYKEHCTDHTRPYEGIPELLSALRAAGVKTAVLSNKADYGVQELCARYFPGMFDFAAGEKAGVRKKPAPDGVFTILEQLKIPATETVYIGDSEVDIKTAENSGTDSIIVDWGFRDRELLINSGAKVIASAPKEVLRLIIGE